MTFSSDSGFCPGFCSEASHGQYCTYGPKIPSKSQDVPGRPLQLLTRNHFFQSERPEPSPPLKFLAKKSLKIPIIQGVQILLNPTFPTFWGFILLLSYILGFVLLILLFGIFPTFVLLFVFFSYFSYFLGFNFNTHSNS